MWTWAFGSSYRGQEGEPGREGAGAQSLAHVLGLHIFNARRLLLAMAPSPLPSFPTFLFPPALLAASCCCSKPERVLGALVLHAAAGLFLNAILRDAFPVGRNGTAAAVHPHSASLGCVTCLPNIQSQMYCPSTGLQASESQELAPFPAESLACGSGPGV